MNNSNFVILWPRESISSTEFTTNQYEDLLQLPYCPNKHYKQRIYKVQDNYDNSFASKGKSISASSYNFELECPIAANLQKVMIAVNEEGSWFCSGRELDKNYLSLH